MTWLRITQWATALFLILLMLLLLPQTEIRESEPKSAAAPRKMSATTRRIRAAAYFKRRREALIARDNRNASKGAYFPASLCSEEESERMGKPGWGKVQRRMRDAFVAKRALAGDCPVYLRRAESVAAARPVPTPEELAFPLAYSMLVHKQVREAAASD